MGNKFKGDGFELIKDLKLLFNGSTKELQSSNVNTSLTSSRTFPDMANKKLPHLTRWVQQSLNKLLGRNLQVTGSMSKETVNAIQDFQRRNGLRTNGILNYRTLKLLHSAGIPPSSVLLQQKYLRGPLLPNKLIIAQKIQLNTELQYDVLTPIATGIGIVKSIIELEKDVIWYKEEFKQDAIFPFNRKDSYNKPWKARSFQVKQSLQAMIPSGYYQHYKVDVVYATFEVKYHYNGNAVGYISLDKIGADAGIGNSLVVEQTINPNPNTYAIGKERPLAMIELSFTYTFKSIFSSPLIWVAKFLLYGNGTIGMRNKWTQGNPDFAYDKTERDGVLKKKAIIWP